MRAVIRSHTGSPDALPVLRCEMRVAGSRRVRKTMECRMLALGGTASRTTSPSR